MSVEYYEKKLVKTNRKGITVVRNRYKELKDVLLGLKIKWLDLIPSLKHTARSARLQNAVAEKVAEYLYSIGSDEKNFSGKQYSGLKLIVSLNVLNEMVYVTTRETKENIFNTSLKLPKFDHQNNRISYRYLGFHVESSLCSDDLHADDFEDQDIRVVGEDTDPASTCGGGLDLDAASIKYVPDVKKRIQALKEELKSIKKENK